MAQAQSVPVIIEVGEYVGFRTTVMDPSGVVIPDLSSYRAYVRYGGPIKDGMVLRAKLELSTEDGGIQRDGNLFRWAITPETSRLLITGVWQMVVISPSDHPTRIYEGPVTVKPEIKGAAIVTP
jgi:hypothetical protein